MLLPLPRRTLPSSPHVASPKTKDLLLLRHAKSSWDDPLLDDFDRPLAKRGRNAARRMGDWLAAQAVRPDLILCSPAKRTRETLDLIAPALGPDMTAEFDRDLYLATADDLLRRLQQVDSNVGTVLVIGHNPGLQDLALALAAPRSRERARFAEKFPTAALARFRPKIARWSALEPRRGALIAYVRPADLDD